MGQRERCAYEHSGIIDDDSPVLASRLEVQAGCHNYQQIVFAQHTIKKTLFLQLEGSLTASSLAKKVLTMKVLTMKVDVRHTVCLCSLCASLKEPYPVDSLLEPDN